MYHSGFWKSDGSIASGTSGTDTEDKLKSIQILRGTTVHIAVSINNMNSAISGYQGVVRNAYFQRLDRVQSYNGHAIYVGSKTISIDEMKSSNLFTGDGTLEAGAYSIYFEMFYYGYSNGMYEMGSANYNYQIDFT